MKKIILVSSSPRRRELLKRIIDNFEIVKPEVEEKDCSSPIDTAVNNARVKAYSIKRKKDEIIISCDTVVSCNHKIYGKPSTKAQALQMLNELKGKWHNVYSGVCILTEKENSYYVRSKVFIKELSEKQLSNYVEEYKPYDKAGAYGVQDNIIVKEYKGDYFNIVGLPLNELRKILRENGLDVKG